MNFQATINIVEEAELNWLRFNCVSMHEYLDAVMHVAKSMVLKY